MRWQVPNRYGVYEHADEHTEYINWQAPKRARASVKITLLQVGHDLWSWAVDIALPDESSSFLPSITKHTESRKIALEKARRHILQFVEKRGGPTARAIMCWAERLRVEQEQPA